MKYEVVEQILRNMQPGTASIGLTSKRGEVARRAANAKMLCHAADQVGALSP
jgi:hypothetical protein